MLPIHYGVQGLIPGGMAVVAKSERVIFPECQIHVQVCLISIIHIFPLKRERTVDAAVQAVCNLWVIMPVQGVCVHTRIFCGK